MLSLYLLRHSNAEEKPPKGESSDAARQLTQEGREKARLIGRAFRRLQLAFDIVLSSPASRAKETAELVVAELPPSPRVELLDALWIGGQASAVVARLQHLSRRTRHVLLVGHEPDLGRFAAQLLCGRSGLSVLFKKGGLCKLTTPQLKLGRCATVEWLLTPRHLKFIADSKFRAK